MKVYNVSEPIVNHYINLVRANKRTIDNVPYDLREEVAHHLGISLEELTLEKAIESKIQELSESCEKTIFAGTDVELSSGMNHYSFTTNDQNNIKNLYDVAESITRLGKASETKIPYHADNNECELFSCEDIIALYFAEQKYILYHNTYFNMMKAMVKNLSSIEEVESISYGSELSEEYKEKMDEILQQSETLFVVVSEN